jgi:hypothetical protein
MEVSLLLAINPWLDMHSRPAIFESATCCSTCNPWVDLHSGFCARYYNACFNPAAIWCGFCACISHLWEFVLWGLILRVVEDFAGLRMLPEVRLQGLDMYWSIDLTM